MPNRKEFFDSHNKRFESLTFDDVLMKPGHSDVSPDMVDTKSRITRNIQTRVPLITAAMDTVTEAPMAIAAAKAGASGVIHRLLEPALQAKEVSRAKSATSMLIRTPITKGPEMGVQELCDWSAERKKAGKTFFDTHPIVDESGRLLGLVGGKDVRYCRDKSRPLSSIMTPLSKLVHVPPGITPEKAYELMLGRKVSALPLVDKNGKLEGMYLLTDLERIFSSDRGGYNLDDKGTLIVAAAIGTAPSDLDRAALLVKAGVNILVIDTAHGDSDAAAAQTSIVKKLFPDVDVVAGNVATGQGAQLLCQAGADAIKVGIGPGSICTTRIVTGVGAPQLTAIFDCAQVARDFGVPVIADGGIRSTGDMIKAFCAGAETVMLGSLFAGTDESPGQVTIEKGREVKDYRGMGSAAVMAKSGERYRQNKDNFIAEGVEGTVPYRGSVSRVIGQYVNGIRAGCGYVGARTIADLPQLAEFIRISNNGLHESYPHDIFFTES